MSNKAWKRIGLGMILLSLVLFFANTNCYAEGAGDYFLYDVGKLPNDILIDSVGIITFSIEEIEKGLQLYERDKNIFISKNIIQIKETYPVGEGGYGGWYKYLVVNVVGDYVKIVLNPYRNSRAWVKLNKETANEYNLIIFDELIGKDLKTKKINEIDIFILSKEIKLYKEPDENSNHIIVKKELQEWRVFYPIVFSKDFVQIGQEYFSEDTMETTFGEPIGWIKTRNNDGKITFYLYTCFWL
jgi:hypothetical protein